MEILVVHIKRFEFSNGRIQKIEDPIRCNKVLALAIQEGDSLKNASYRLTSVIHHTGSPISGHYTTTVLQNGSDLFLCNDSRVSRCKRIDYKSAYVLFYVRI